MASLLDLKLFQEIEMALQSDELKNFSIKVIESPPENVIMLGRMPDALKGLVMLHTAALQLQEDAFLKLVREGVTYSEEQIYVAREQIRQLEQTTRLYEDLFWEATSFQYGIELDDRKYGYTSDFEVYVEP